jgi:thiol-disulfide isomerase/thioredoxin
LFGCHRANLPRTGSFFYIEGAIWRTLSSFLKSATPWPAGVTSNVVEWGTSSNVRFEESMVKNAESGIFRRVLGGAAQGAFFFGLVALVASAAFQSDVHGTWHRVVFFALIGALSLGTGQAIGQGALGAVLGGLLGAAVGGGGADRLGVHFIYADTDPPRQSEPLEFAGPTLDGQAFDSRDWKGKVVLVDFWATWCGPCVAELPNVRDVYDRYHADGFEVIGISLDKSREKLSSFVQENGTPWPQIFIAGETGWNNPLVRKYGVQAIPATILLDQDGRPTAVELRGRDLEEQVARLLGANLPFSPSRLDRLQLDLARMPPVLTGSILLGCFLGAFCGAFLQRRGARPDRQKVETSIVTSP